MERKPFTALAMPGWKFEELRVVDIGEPRYVRVRALHLRDGLEFNVTWPEHDDNDATRDIATGSLLFAVARFIADPAAYYRAQYERQMAELRDGAATDT